MALYFIVRVFCNVYKKTSMTQKITSKTDENLLFHD